MFAAAIILSAAAVTGNLLYFKIKHDKLLFPMISAVIFSVIISSLLYPKTETADFIKYFTVMSLLHICSTNDIIRHRSDNIFPVLIIAVGLIIPANIGYSLFSLTVTVVFFVIIIVVCKDTIGGGDIKMICALSFFFGIAITVNAMITACIAGIIYAAAAKISAKLPDPSKRFAFLPFVEIGYITALLLSFTK